jgi:hypothetical protein
MLALLLGVLFALLTYTTEADAKTYRYCVRIAERFSVYCYDCKTGWPGGEGGRTRCSIQAGPSSEGHGVNVRFGRCSEARNAYVCQR